MKPREVVLTHGELCGLLELHALEMRPASPLKSVVKGGPEGNAREFARRGLMGDDWRAALATLCRPDFEARSLLAFPETTTVAVYYADRSGDGTLVGCREEGDCVHVAFPWETSQVAKVDADAIDASGSPKPDSGELQMSIEALSVLAAAVDVVRTVLLTSILQRAAVPELMFRSDDLRELLAMGVDGMDARWVVTLLRMLAPPKCGPLASDFDNGFRELLDLGLLSADRDGTWRPRESIQRMAAYWKVPLPATAHETATLRPDGSQESRCRVTLRGDGPLWTIDYAGIDGNAPRVTLRSVDGDVWFLELLGMLAPPAPEAARPKRAPAPAKRPGFCTSCGAPLSPGKRFCTKCGAAVPGARAAGKEPVVATVVSQCSQCGAKLNPGTRFCTKCGASVH